MSQLRVKVVPGASRSRIAGWLGDELKLTVSAPPESGKANDAVVKLLADALRIPATQISVSAGHSRPHKTISFAQLTDADLDDHLTRAGFPRKPRPGA